MDKRTATSADARIPSDEIAALVGNVDDTTLAAIVALFPSRTELEAALAWADRESDVMGEERLPLAGKVAEIYELLVADENYEDER